MNDKRAAMAEIILSQYYAENAKPERWLFDGVPMSGGGVGLNAIAAAVCLEWVAAVHDALLGIPAADRVLVEDYLLQGVPLEDIAEWQGTSVEGVRVRARIALSLFYREFMAQIGKRLQIQKSMI